MLEGNIYALDVAKSGPSQRKITYDQSPEAEYKIGEPPTLP